MHLKVGDSVWVPAVKLGLADSDHALVRRDIRVVTRRSFQVDVLLGQQQLSQSMSVAFAQRDVGVLILTIGDFETEERTLGPLSRSIEEYLRLLLPDDMLRSVFVRGEKELETAWAKHAGACSHVVVIGHCDGKGMWFGADDKIVSARRLSEIMTGKRREFVAAACMAGRAEFAKRFSEATETCVSLVAPFASVHAAQAASFTMSYFSERWLGGRSSKVAFNRLRSTESFVEARYRFWSDGTWEGS